MASLPLGNGQQNADRVINTMRGYYEGRGHPDKTGLRALLVRYGREHLLPLVNRIALAGCALDDITEGKGLVGGFFR